MPTWAAYLIGVVRVFLYGMITGVVSMGTAFAALVNQMEPRPTTIAQIDQISGLLILSGGLIVMCTTWVAYLAPSPTRQNGVEAFAEKMTKAIEMKLKREGELPI